MAALGRAMVAAAVAEGIARRQRWWDIATIPWRGCCVSAVAEAERWRR